MIVTEWENDLDVIYQAWEACNSFHHQVKHQEENWKYDAQQNILDELRGISAGDETNCWMLWCYFSNKMILGGEINDAKMSGFSADFQTLIQH